MKERDTYSSNPVNWRDGSVKYFPRSKEMGVLNIWHVPQFSNYVQFDCQQKSLKSTLNCGVMIGLQNSNETAKTEIERDIFPFIHCSLRDVLKLYKEKFVQF